MSPKRAVVLLSGGLDSTVLLHALAHSPVARERGLRAVHVDHRFRGGHLMLREIKLRFTLRE